MLKYSIYILLILFVIGCNEDNTVSTDDLVEALPRAEAPGIRTYGGTDHDKGNAVVSVNGGFIIAGQDGLYWGDAYLSKIDYNGDTIWTNKYGGSELDYATGLISLGDEIIVTGNTESIGYGNSDIWIFKVDINGEIEWEKTIGSEERDVANIGIKTDDGNILIGGWTKSTADNAPDGYLVCLSTDGSLLWEKKYGGSGSQYILDITETSDGYTLLGFTGNNPFLIFIDKDGNEISIEYIEQSPTYFKGYSFAPANDGYIVVGETDSAYTTAGLKRMWATQVGSDNEVMWSKILTEVEETKAVKIVPYKQGYLLLGDLNGNVLLRFIDETTDVIWEKLFGGEKQDGSTNLLITKDNNILITGFTYSYGAGGSDMLAIYLDENGNLLWD